VRDRGTGIPEEFRGRIFEKFAQADGSSARRFEGTGLGLNITQRLLEAMHGTIGFTTAIGEGTTFYFELPAASPDSVPAVDQRALTARYRVLSPVLERVPRILHVEDDRDLSQVIEAALAGRAELVTATTLKSAEDLLRAGDFALLVLDLGLPDGNGLALLDRLEELLPEPIPVVILSVSEVSQAVQQRVAASLVKSCLSEAEVVETILSLVAQEA
jgi:CheY-like chemotaxis protein